MEQQEIQGRRVTRVRGAVDSLDLLVNKDRLERMDLKVTFYLFKVRLAQQG